MRNLICVSVLDYKTEGVSNSVEALPYTVVNIIIFLEKESTTCRGAYVLILTNSYLDDYLQN